MRLCGCEAVRLCGRAVVRRGQWTLFPRQNTKEEWNGVTRRRFCYSHTSSPRFVDGFEDECHASVNRRLSSRQRLGIFAEYVWILKHVAKRPVYIFSFHLIDYLCWVNCWHLENSETLGRSSWCLVACQLKSDWLAVECEGSRQEKRNFASLSQALMPNANICPALFRTAPSLDLINQSWHKKPPNLKLCFFLDSTRSSMHY